MAEEKKQQVKRPHSLILEDRAFLTVTGVSDVDSFTDQKVVAYTDLGELSIFGSNLKINKLSVETGELTLEGDVFSMSYSDNQKASGGFFARLLK